MYHNSEQSNVKIYFEQYEIAYWIKLYAKYRMGAIIRAKYKIRAID